MFNLAPFYWHNKKIITRPLHFEKAGRADTFSSGQRAGPGLVINGPGRAAKKTGPVPSLYHVLCVDQLYRDKSINSRGIVQQ
jgi:hypothetical protein